MLQYGLLYNVIYYNISLVNLGNIKKFTFVPIKAVLKPRQICFTPHNSGSNHRTSRFPANKGLLIQQIIKWSQNFNIAI